MSVCWKPGMTWPVRGKSVGNWGNANVAVAVERWTCPVAVPTAMEGALGLRLQTGAAGEKYIPVAPESTIPVFSILNRGGADGAGFGGLHGAGVGGANGAGVGGLHGAGVGGLHGASVGGLQR